MSKIDIQTIKNRLTIDDICNVVESLGGVRKGENCVFMLDTNIIYKWREHCHIIRLVNGKFVED